MDADLSKSLSTIRRLWAPGSMWTQAYAPAIEQVNSFFWDISEIHKMFLEMLRSTDPAFPNRVLPYARPRKPRSFSVTSRYYLFSPGLELLEGVFVGLSKTDRAWAFMAKKQMCWSENGLFELSELEGYPGPENNRWAQVADDLLINSTLWECVDDIVEGGRIPASVFGLILVQWAKKNLVDLKLFGPNSQRRLNTIVNRESSANPGGTTL